MLLLEDVYTDHILSACADRLMHDFELSASSVGPFFY